MHGAINIKLFKYVICPRIQGVIYLCMSQTSEECWYKEVSCFYIE